MASRIGNLFSSGSTSTEQGNRSSFGFADDGLPEGKRDLFDSRVGTGAFQSNTMAQKTDEDEGRPPYLHVRGRNVQAIQTLLILIVHDCWRNWRHHR